MVYNNRANNSFDMEVKLSPKEVIERIIDRSDEMSIKTDREAWLAIVRGYKGDRPFQHQIEDGSIFIQKRPERRNFQHGVRICIEPTPSGSRLAGHVALNPSTKGFIRLWYCGLGLMSIIAIVSFVRQVEKPGDVLLVMLFLAGMAAFGYFWIQAARRFSKKETRQISEWLKTVFADSKVESGFERDA